jgi:tetratricopeptide (TPR) repeat protein
VAQNSYQKAESLFINNQFEAAEPIFKEHLSTYPNDLKTLEYLGDIAGHKKQWDMAIGYYKKLVESQDDNAKYHYKYGGVLGMKALEVNKLKALTMISDIKSSFLKAAELDPNHIDVRWALVEFYIQLPGIIGGSEKKAINYANELENLSKVDGYLSKGYIAEYSNRPKDAEMYYRKAVNLGGSITCYQKLTDLYENTTKEPEKAISVIEEAQSIHHRNALHYQLGKVSAQYNTQLDKGMACLEKYIENHSEKDGVPKSWAYYRIAQIYKHKGNKDQAIKYIDLALSEKDLKPFKKEKDHILNM